MRNTPFWWILIGMMIVLDIYFFQAIKIVSQPAGNKTRLIIYAIYWTISVSAIVILIILPYLHFEHQHRVYRTTLFAMIAGLFFAKLVGCLFFLLDDLRRGFQWAGQKIFDSKKIADASGEGEGISRSVFLSWAGIVAGSGIFGSLIWGFGNKYRYQVKRTKLSYGNLPAAFKGLRIVHISDIHCGSFADKQAVKKRC